MKKYDVVNLRFVDVRKYNGVEDGCHSWTFLGYDVVELDKMGKAKSILAEDETCYDILKPIDGNEKLGLYDHKGILNGDVRIKVIDRPQLGIFGNSLVVDEENIKEWIKKRPEFYFLHYQQQEQGKVKKLGEKK